jgi:hypothetical protein
MTTSIWNLHVQAAKLCLHSHVFRGMSAVETTTPGGSISPAIRQIASTARDHAVNFQKGAVTITGLYNLPAYLTTMTSFAAVFMLRAASKSLSEPLFEQSNDNELLASLHTLSVSLHNAVDGRPVAHPLQAVANGIDVGVTGRVEATSQPLNPTFVPIAPAPTRSSVPDPGLVPSSEQFSSDFLGPSFDDDMSWMTFPFAQAISRDCPDAEPM